jgi:hypothetical protein
MLIVARSQWMIGMSLLGVSLNLGCFASGRGYQLYPGPPADPAAVARLSGHVQTVDGKNVGRYGHSFELLPGCHVITTPKSWGGVGESGGVVANTGAIPYAIRMLAGHSYSIEVKPESGAGSIQNVRILAKEKDASGKVTGSFSPALEDRTCQDEHRGGKDLVVPVPSLGQ